MKKHYLFYFLLVLLLADLAYSFVQHYSMPLDGDMASGIVPSAGVTPVLNDPFGFSVITENAFYPNPNRFFAHWTFFTYFNTVPFWLQKFVSPIESIYLACAIAKILIQLAILLALSFFITGRRKIISTDFLIGAILIVPLFQTNGYRTYMGIIDPSITYTFFYALPCALILLFYLPFYFDTVHGTAITKKWGVKIMLFAASFFIVFNGALNAGIILIITLLFGINSILKTDKNLSLGKRIVKAYQMAPKTFVFFFSLISLLCLYALIIGQNNLIFVGETVSIGERYLRIPQGILNLISSKMGYPILLILIGLNIFFLRKKIQNEEVKKVLRFFSWIGAFSLLYILLLPFGGYKFYRPNIVRYDTIMPVTIALIFIYGMSSYQLIKHINGKYKVGYLALIALSTFIFTNADQPGFDKNADERLALEKIAKSKDKIVFIESDCTILSWGKITDPKKSDLNGWLLKKWRITQEHKRYYQGE